MQLRHDRITGVSLGGTEYLADEAGVFEVPDGAAPRLMAEFGLRPMGADRPPEGEGGEGNGPAAPDRPLIQWKTEALMAEAVRRGLPAEGKNRKDRIALISADRASQ
jgi:hypothetical protein